MKLSRVGEFEFIRRIARGCGAAPGVPLGVGDDAAALLPPRHGNLLLVTCDPVVEGVHFDRGATDFQIGWKAMARNLSDIAAMGGTPRAAVVAASLPADFPLARALAIQRGLQAAAHKFGTRIVGGDTSRSRHGISLTVTLLGEVPRGEMTRRSGARPGHVLLVTGTLGGSLAGKHLRFLPRLREARFLAQHFHPTAMIDLSDGLASDVQRLAEQSRAGFEIWADCLPLSAEIRRRRLPHSAKIRHALRDGEDYELLFTLPAGQLPALGREWKRRFRLALTPIGMVRPRAFGLRLRDGADWRPLPPPGNDHFRK